MTANQPKGQILGINGGSFLQYTLYGFKRRGESVQVIAGFGAEKRMGVLYMRNCNGIWRFYTNGIGGLVCAHGLGRWSSIDKLLNRQQIKPILEGIRTVNPYLRETFVCISMTIFFLFFSQVPEWSRIESKMNNNPLIINTCLDFDGPEKSPKMPSVVAILAVSADR